MTTRKALTKAAQAGFTLIELMVAITIVAMMMTIAWGTTQQTIRAKKHYEKVQERYREVRVAMNKIVRDLSMAYISTNEDQTLMDRRTFFISEPTGDVDSVRFTTFAHQRLYQDANETDQTIVAYYSGPDPDERRQTNLYRRESRRLANEKWDTIPGEADILFAGIEKFELEFWDVQDQEWEDSWNTVSADGKANKVPDRVKIRLTFLDERGKEVTFTTQSRIHLQETIQFFTN